MEQWQSEQINELVSAIVKAQISMVPAKKDTNNPFFHKKYADLPTCWDAVEPFRKNGIAITQSPMDTEDGFILLDTQLSHISGQWMRSRLKIRVAKNDPQGYGSAITYARRYALGCMTGLVTEEDDDGNAASNPQQRQAQSFQQQKRTAQAKIQELRESAPMPPSPGGSPPSAQPESGVDLDSQHSTPDPLANLVTDTILAVREAESDQALNVLLRDFVLHPLKPGKKDKESVDGEVAKRRKQLKGGI